MMTVTVMRMIVMMMVTMIMIRGMTVAILPATRGVSAGTEMGGETEMSVARAIGVLVLAMMMDVSADAGRPLGVMMRCGGVLPVVVGAAVAGSR
jgi:hypothetical protein